MPLEPGVITHIAAMASRFGQKHWNTKQPEQKTQTNNQHSQRAPQQHPPMSLVFLLFFFWEGGEERAPDEGPQRDNCAKCWGQLSLNPVSP